MAVILVATEAGCRVLAATGESQVELDGRQVSALAPEAAGTCLALVGSKEVWRRSVAGQWSQVATSTLALGQIVSVGGRILGGSLADPALVSLTSAAGAGGGTERLTGFDQVEGRKDWFGEGPPLHVRSMTATADGAALFVAVHVGGIPRSGDGGRTWAPTVPIKYDVHEVRAHPTLPNVVAAAAAAGLCLSQDAGRSWSLLTNGLEETNSLAVAALHDEVLFSIQDGPFAKRSQIYRWRLGGTSAEQVQDGLPPWLDGKVDTGHLAAGAGRAAVLDRGGNLWLSASGSVGWQRIAAGLPPSFAIALLA